MTGSFLCTWSSDLETLSSRRFFLSWKNFINISISQFYKCKISYRMLLFPILIKKKKYKPTNSCYYKVFFGTMTFTSKLGTR